MKRIIIAGTIALLVAVIVTATIGQDGLLQVFISNDAVSQAVRVVLIGLLATLLLSSQPRSIEFRSALSVASAILSVGVAITLSQNYMAALDALIYIEIAIIFALESIESPVLARNATKTKAHSI
ncbi:MAG: hypothetical protein V4611_01865 [Patescibacteria group bacterium]